MSFCKKKFKKKAQGGIPWAFTVDPHGLKVYFTSLHFPYFSLKIRWRSLPVGVMGLSSSLMKSTVLGILYPAIFPLQCSTSSFSVTVFPAWRVTTAFTDSPHFSWGTPITPTYLTAG